MRIRILGTVAVTALALTAIAGTAVASTSQVAAEQYPAGIAAKATGMHYLTTNIGEMGCENSTFTGVAPEALETLSASPETACSSFGAKAAMKMNGCEFEFHPGTETTFGQFGGTFDIGPSGCGPIRLQVGACDISIGAQSGLQASFQNVGAGSSSAVQVTAAAAGLKYSQSNLGCGGIGTFTNGKYNGSWSAQGNFEGEPTGLYVESDHEPMFEAEEYPVSLAGGQTSGGSHVLSTGPGKEIKCQNVAFAGTASGASSTAALTPTYSSCTAFSLPATVVMNGCSYAYTAGEQVARDEYSGSMAVVCPAGKFLRVTTATCEVQISSQAGLGSVDYLNGTQSGHGAVTIEHALGGMVYTVTKDGIGCPLSGKGTFADGTYAGATELQGKNGKSALQSIRVGG